MTQTMDSPVVDEAAETEAEAAYNQFIDLLYEISEGNPGALTVLVQIMQAEPEAAPYILRYLLEFGPKGSSLWILYKDECLEDLDTLLSVLGRKTLVHALETFDGTDRDN